MTITDELIDSLKDKITNSFSELFRDAGESLEITTWTDRFDLIDTGIEDSTSNTVKWIITFEDRQGQHAHFTLHMDGQEPDDFSIDT